MMIRRFVFRVFLTSLFDLEFDPQKKKHTHTYKTHQVPFTPLEIHQSCVSSTGLCEKDSRGIRRELDRTSIRVFQSILCFGTYCSRPFFSLCFNYVTQIRRISTHSRGGGRHCIENQHSKINRYPKTMRRVTKRLDLFT